MPIRNLEQWLETEADSIEKTGLLGQALKDEIKTRIRTTYELACNDTLEELNALGTFADTPAREAAEDRVNEMIGRAMYQRVARPQ